MNSLPSLLTMVLVLGWCAWAFCQPPAESSPEKSAKTSSSQNDSSASPSLKSDQSSQAGEILRTARERIRRYTSIRSKIKETIEINERRYSMEGSYLQGRDLQMRLEFQLELNGVKASMLELCDGQVLWTRMDLSVPADEPPKILRRDVRDIIATARETGRSSPKMLIAELGLGGISELLASIEQNMNLRRLPDAEIDGRKQIVLEGTWNEAWKLKWGQSPTSKNVDVMSQLPAFIPDSLQISLDERTMFPSRLVYLKKVPGRKISRPLITMDFTETTFDKPVRDEEFSFVPPENAQEVDITKQFIDQIEARGKPAEGPPAKN